MNGKIAGYVRGKFLEIVLVWVVSYLTFLVFGLNYAVLLSFSVGVSVLIPYVGAAIVTVPVAIVAYFQWGYSYETLYIVIAYMVIQFLDGNLLVPFLFSEMVNLHPAAIIVAVLFFGGLWGVLGVFFAIPLATLEYPYKIIRSKRSKYLRIKLSNRGELSITMPQSTTLDCAQQFIHSKQEWIEKNLRKINFDEINQCPNMLDFKLLLDTYRTESQCWSSRK